MNVIGVIRLFPLPQKNVSSIELSLTLFWL